METSESLNKLGKDSSASCELDIKPVETILVGAADIVTRPKETPSAPGSDGLHTTSAPELLPERESVQSEECKAGDDAYEASAKRIKEESELGSKECVLCGGCTDDTFDIYCETTCCGQVTLCAYICKVGHMSRDRLAGSDFLCYSCFELINLTERAEIEYLKQKSLLLDVISQNPALALKTLQPFAVEIEYMKSERCKSERRFSSEDDEPLASMKPSRRTKAKKDCKSAPRQDERNFSSDEDFCWKEEENEENRSNTCRLKKHNGHRVKDDIIEVDSIVPKVEFKKPAADKDVNIPNERNKCRNRPKKSNRKSRNTLGTARNSNEQAIFKCAQCTRIFTKKGVLDQHMERHKRNPKPYICEVCGKRFKYRKLCDSHALMHQGIADWKCIPCNKLFPTKVAFLRHDKIHNGTPNHQCDLCGKSFIHYSSLRNHKIAHAGVRKYACEQCGLALLSNASLTRHRLVHTGEKKYECDVCGKKFARNSNMHTHMKTHAKEKGRPRRTPPPDVPGRRKRFFRCDMCPERFDRLFKLECHLVDDHNVHLKKGRPKPRHTMKKMQRAQQAAASMVNAIATAMGSRKSLTISFKKPPADVKPSVSNIDGKINEKTATTAPIFKTSPQYNSVSPGTSYMSPPQVTVEPVPGEYRDHHHPTMRSVNTVYAVNPHVAYSMGGEYLGRTPDYTQQ